MITFDLSTLVDRPMPEVFTFLSNPLNLPSWQMMIAKIEQVTPGTPSVGSKYKVAAEIMGRKIDGLMELTTLEPPTRFGFTNQAGPMQVTVTVSLKPAGSGTHITLNGQGNPGGVLKIAESLLANQVKTQMETNLSRLKTLLESNK